MVCGKRVKTFSEASHIVFNGHLDDPCFRAIAIQRITDLTNKAVSGITSGELEIQRNAKGEFVRLEYDAFIGKAKTTGHPFKDQDTEVFKIGD